ncbi:MAG: 2-C-methyl-D-erythritol 4-phosphate cytidylyltransferase [Bacteroidetes bacterium]|nr:MAG: 2-C-methyl-D-erythritol 4-phosphate cytidylyltransferase [Bacteroidota bacterium]MBL1143394.1 2-C-methyl-D-erythritol 4-phosphate cytidylyltransferase [Bacteroidota bacterium]NOG56198.1 2-C-methyl-D-erythritol 4-phosphate cytidylyltransferase [Bacteroidota bacterium]
MKKQMIVVAGGSGIRMGTEIPKQFILLNGKAILLHTLERIAEEIEIENIILVLPESEIDRWVALSSGTKFENLKCALGGATRYDSVKSGLKLIDKDALVGIHDAVRPFVSQNTIASCFKMAEEKGSAIPVVELKDSIRRVFTGTSRAKDRTKFRLVQTPQCFNAARIKAAYEKPNKGNFTDDASVYEEAGNRIHLVEGNNENIKITSPEDLKIAASFLS